MEILEDISYKFEGLPIWLRWILFLPISFVLAAAAGWLVRLLKYGQDDFEFAADLLHTTVSHAVFLFLLYRMVPTWKLQFFTVFSVLRGTILLLFLSTPILIYAGADVEVDKGLVLDTLGEGFCLIISILLFKYFKKEAKELQLYDETQHS